MNCNTGPIATSIYEYGLPIILLVICSIGLTFIIIKIYNQIQALNQSPNKQVKVVTGRTADSELKGSPDKTDNIQNKQEEMR